MARTRSNNGGTSRPRTTARRAAKRTTPELTNLETKLGEVIGLAMAAQGGVDKISKLVTDRELKRQLKTMKAEAADAEKSSTAIAASIAGKKGAILKEAREVKQKATKMMTTYLDRSADGLDGFEFLTMAEAAEVGHWQIVGKMNERAHVPGLEELVTWVTPIQQRHFETSLQGSLKLASEEDPNETEG